MNSIVNYGLTAPIKSNISYDRVSETSSTAYIAQGLEKVASVLPGLVKTVVEVLKLMSTESVMPSNYLILCHSLLFLPLNLSQHQGLFQ